MFRRDPLLEPFGTAKFILKSLVIFGIFMATLGDFAGWNEILKEFQETAAEENFFLVACFLLFLTGHLIYELLIRLHRARLERLRSSPQVGQQSSHDEDDSTLDGG